MIEPVPRQALLDALSEPLGKRGYDLEDVEVGHAGRRSLVRVMVDSDDGVTLDAIAEATHIVNGVLDGHDIMGEQPYTLEVTSPGVDRPLTHARHWRRNTDRLVKISWRDGTEVTGRILAAGGSSATIESEGTSREAAYADIATARVQIEFNRPTSAAGTRHPSGKE